MPVSNAKPISVQIVLDLTNNSDDEKDSLTYSSSTSKYEEALSSSDNLIFKEQKRKKRRKQSVGASLDLSFNSSASSYSLSAPSSPAPMATPVPSPQASPFKPKKNLKLTTMDCDKIPSIFDVIDAEHKVVNLVTLYNKENMDVDTMLIEMRKVIGDTRAKILVTPATIMLMLIPISSRNTTLNDIMNLVSSHIMENMQVIVESRDRDAFEFMAEMDECVLTSRKLLDHVRRKAESIQIQRTNKTHRPVIRALFSLKSADNEQQASSVTEIILSKEEQQIVWGLHPRNLISDTTPNITDEERSQEVHTDLLNVTDSTNLMPSTAKKEMISFESRMNVDTNTMTISYVSQENNIIEVAGATDITQDTPQTQEHYTPLDYNKSEQEAIKALEPSTILESTTKPVAIEHKVVTEQEIVLKEVETSTNPELEPTHISQNDNITLKYYESPQKPLVTHFSIKPSYTQSRQPQRFVPISPSSKLSIQSILRDCFPQDVEEFGFLCNDMPKQQSSVYDMHTKDKTFQQDVEFAYSQNEKQLSPVYEMQTVENITNPFDVNTLFTDDE